jgi:hypothetical protein
MSETDKRDWPIEMVRRETPQPVSGVAITVCPKCDSRNLFHGGGRVKCRDCGFVEDVLKRKVDENLPTELAQDTKAFMQDFRRDRGH